MKNNYSDIFELSISPLPCCCEEFDKKWSIDKSSENIKLFASYGFCSGRMREKFAGVIPQDASLCHKTCIIIPYAGFDDKKTGAREKQGMIEFGFNPQNIFIADDGGFDDKKPFDYIYVPGGDPFKLLRTIRQKDLGESIVGLIKNGNSIYIGVSAGAYIACPNIKYVECLEDNNCLLPDTSGLNIIEQSIICHFDHYSISDYANCKSVCQTDIITLNDEHLICYDKKEWKYVG